MNVDYSASGYSPLTGCWKNSKECSISVRGREFLENSYKVIMDSTAWSTWVVGWFIG